MKNVIHKGTFIIAIYISQTVLSYYNPNAVLELDCVCEFVKKVVNYDNCKDYTRLCVKL